MECDVCNCPINVGDNLYSCVIDEEYLEDRCYTVTSAYSFVSICQNCLEWFNPVAEIGTRMSTYLLTSPKSNLQTNVSAIHNMYDCRKCNQPIRNGEKLVTINHCFETQRQNSLQSIQSDIAFLMCKPCATVGKIEQGLEGIIEIILPVAKKAIFHSLKD